MRVRLQADADLHGDIIAGVRHREPALDFRTADVARLRGVEDAEVLRRTAEANRILVTHDRRTMPYHFAEFIRSQPSPGVFLIAQRLSLRVAIDALVLVWEASEHEEWQNLLVELPL